MLELWRRMGTLDGLALDRGRELGRTAGQGDSRRRTDPYGTLARDVLEIKLAPNQTFAQLSELMQPSGTNFAHGYYNEARARGRSPGVRAEDAQSCARCARVQRGRWSRSSAPSPNLYGRRAEVEFIDHTGQVSHGHAPQHRPERPASLAEVCYLASFRDGWCCIWSPSCGAW